MIDLLIFKMEAMASGGNAVMKNSVVYTTMPSPIGPLTIAKTDKGICYIDFGDSTKNLVTLQLWCQRWLQQDELTRGDDEDFAEIIEQLNEYFAGKRKEFTVPIDLYGTPFQVMVWQELLNIPYGQTRSYKDIAMAVDTPKAVRAIGGANHNNPIPIIVPCHRVIGSNGALVGYGGGLSIKEHLLQLEQANTVSKAL